MEYKEFCKKYPPIKEEEPITKRSEDLSPKREKETWEFLFRDLDFF